jgi:hypothetical protein
MNDLADEETLLNAVTTALDRIKNLETLILSWEDRLRACEFRSTIHFSPRPDGSALSSTSSFVDEPISLGSRPFGVSLDKKCGIKSCPLEAVPEKRFCQKHMSRSCHFPGCTKTRLGPDFCIRHGGGKRCEFPGCTKGASSSVGGGARWCILHGGGRKCKVEGCSSTAKRAGLCSTHGGRYYCSVPGCSKTAHGPRRLCTMHASGRSGQHVALNPSESPSPSTS